ncbi:MAG: hypothetical protein IJO27_01430 [Bacilli bacterium]|nr:hypothetical protein [Bacilli bacterium]
MNKIIYSLIILFLLTFSINVNASTIKDATVNSIIEDVYDVEIFWDKMQYTYNVSEKFVYDDESREYKLERNESWDNSKGDITLTNKSKYEVTANLEYKGLNRFNNIKGYFEKDELHLGINKSVSTKLILEGALESNIRKFTTIGNVSITIN